MRRSLERLPELEAFEQNWIASVLSLLEELDVMRAS